MKRFHVYWVTDPQGIAWEHFHTLASVPVFSESQPAAVAEASACCAPSAPRGKPVGIAVKSSSSCC
jgi:lactoylglutathione lyase